jgi:hypothetical protein
MAGRNCNPPTRAPPGMPRRMPATKRSPQPGRGGSERSPEKRQHGPRSPTVQSARTLYTLPHQHVSKGAEQRDDRDKKIGLRLKIGGTVDALDPVGALATFDEAVAIVTIDARVFAHYLGFSSLVLDEH